MTDILDTIIEAKNNAENAAAAGINPARARESLKNILFNACDGIIEGLRENKELHEEIGALDQALAEADAEIKELKAGGKKKTAEAKMSEE